MSSNLTEEELAALMPSELCQYQTPIPTQIVSSDEFYPDPQNERQREVEARLLAMADELGGQQGLNRRKFFQTAAGMAASFVAMNEVYGPLFDVSRYEKMVAAGIKNVCIHKGLFPPGIEKQYPNLRGFADVADVGQAAKDWPQLNFVIYHSAYRHVGGDPRVALAEFERTGRISWTSDLADIPAQYGVSNVYGDVGQLFATTLVAEPNVCAALMGTLIKGLGADHVCWGTDSLWTGAPQWQIEGLRRLEIPEAMQKKFGFAPLGPADGPVKTAIFGDNNARLYGIQPKRAMLELKGDRFALMKTEYEKAGPEPSNMRYGYVVPSKPIDHTVFA